MPWSSGSETGAAVIPAPVATPEGAVPRRAQLGRQEICSRDNIQQQHLALENGLKID
jgi:hypothetical protein